MKEKRERKCNVTAIMAMTEGPCVKGIDAEDLHERDEVDIPALIRKIEADEERRRGDTGRHDLGTLSGPWSKPLSPQMALRRLTEYRNKAGEVSSVVACDDLTNMRLEAGNVKEARGKEIEYVREIGCMTRYLVIKPFAMAGRSAKHAG